MEFSMPEYWSGQSFLSPGDLPNPGTEPRSPALQAYSLPAEPQRKSKCKVQFGPRQKRRDYLNGGRLPLFRQGGETVGLMIRVNERGIREVSYLNEGLNLLRSSYGFYFSIC